ncbi:hypothetical protein COT94_03225 [Candidatus Falkowbacteria bacterium CG10_big_fil_rev_8_21_14_0_10_37_14]|uniref:Uncharacterized protein n=1 Tax=Candidatus Falkowbacteria bacterium CG10_big_fil_rev_8_21_14_0_10_37_14 TaxID=1974561 RepID=A0A2M6WT53_9BACT|nr:hypothetical protein [Candidatus Falkowbacteria bacterium]PIT95921.1 MAG: hypothetical protein COT94_03225 [Candidatus Falkowbacteria bacterium CG10_big_fil_rev_8_21_14_0_10_37_14]
MNSLTKEQLSVLPEDIYWYLTSNKGDDISLLVARKYGLGAEGIVRLGELLRRIYLKKISPAELPIIATSLFNLSVSLAKQFACDLAGTRLLGVAQWLGLDVSALIISWGGDPTKYRPHWEAQQSAIVTEKQKAAIELRDDDWILENEASTSTESQVEPDIDTKQQVITEYLNSDLLFLLKLPDEDSELIAGLNQDMIFLLGSKPELSTIWSSTLFNNPEILSREILVLNNSAVEPTIGHWLEYFVQSQGTGHLDVITATTFATTDQYAKLLAPLECHWLVKLLLLYGRIKFFPAGQSGDNPEYWQIFSIPVENNELVNSSVESGILTNTTQVYNRPPVVLAELPVTKSAALKPVTPWVAPPIATEPTIISEVTIKPTVADNQVSKALELQRQLDNYPVGSLERLVLEEELRKYQ